MVRFLSAQWLDLHASLGADLPARPGASARLQFVVTGTPDGEVAYVLTIIDGQLDAVTLGRHDNADVTFTESFTDALAIARGELDIHVGFMQGRVKFAGDMGALMSVLPLTQSDDYQALLASVAAATDS